MDPAAEVREAVPLDALHVNLTRSCNLACAFCYAGAVRGRAEDGLSLQDLGRLAEDAAGLGAKRAILSGGEPFLRPDWGEVAALFDARGMEVSLATNGTLITPEVADRLKGFRRVTVAVSVDGDERVHDGLRGQAHAFRRTLAGVRALREAGIWYHLNATLFRGNLECLGALARLARDLSCDLRLSLLHPNGRGEALRAEALDCEQIFRVREFCHELRQRGVNVYVNLPPLLQYLEDIIPGRGPACGWATRFCGVHANGDVSVCGVAVDEPGLLAGNVKSERFAEIWRNAPLFRETRALEPRMLQGVCGRCPFRERCGGACRLSAYREAGDLLAPYALCQRFHDEGYIPQALLD
jgi:radical SAM protein with 4Fe4S-binding SPASM domain